MNATEGEGEEDAAEMQEESSITMLTVCGITPQMLMQKAVEQITTDNAAGIIPILRSLITNCPTFRQLRSNKAFYITERLKSPFVN